MHPVDPATAPNKTLAAVCGLFCPSCTYFIATTEDPGRLAYLAQRRSMSTEECRCYGCRSEQRNPYCATCKMSACVADKGINFSIIWFYHCMYTLFLWHNNVISKGKDTGVGGLCER